MDDLPDLVQFFIERFAAEENKRVVGIEPAALDMLSSYAWPGNIRQLENTVFRGVVLSDSAHLTMADFPQVAAQLGIELRVETRMAERAAVSEAVAEAHSMPIAVGHDIAYSGQGSSRNAAPPSSGTVRLANGVEIKAMDEAGHLRRLEEIENDLIRFAIELYDGHMTEVARRLGIGRSTLYRKLREMGMADRAEAE